MMNLSRLFLIAAAFVLAAVPAQAFEFQSGDGTSVNSRANLLDLDTKAVTDKPAAKFDDSKGIKQGNFYLKFNNEGSFNSRYSTDNLFDPVARDGRQ